MRSKSFAVRSRPHRAALNSLDPSPASLPGEAANEKFSSGVSTTFDERDVPVPKKRHCLGTSETTRGGGRLSLEACIVCDISDEGVSRCSGTGCILWFHGECLNSDLGSCSEDLAKNYCPYCWFKVLVMRHESVREKAVGAEKEVSKYLSKETKSNDHSVDRTDVVSDQELRGEKGVCVSSEKEQFQVEQDSDRSREEDMPLTEEIDYQPQEDTEKFQDAEEDKDDDEETANDQTTGAGGKGDISGKEQDQIQQNEKPRRRRRQLILSDSEISSGESTNERNVEDVTSMQNQQRKHSSTTKVVKSTTVRDTTYFNRDQRKRLFWTPEEEEMLKVGVEKFSAEAKKNMPWRKILEMGQEVFHETRTPADLKDKWRNMMGGRGKKTN